MISSHALFSEDFKVFNSLDEASAAFPTAIKVVPIIHYYPFGQTSIPKPASPPVSTKLRLTNQNIPRLGDIVPAPPLPPRSGTFFWLSPFTALPPVCSGETGIAVESIDGQTVADYVTAQGVPITAGKEYLWISPSHETPPAAYAGLTGECRSPYVEIPPDCDSTSLPSDSDSTSCTAGQGPAGGWDCV